MDQFLLRAVTSESARLVGQEVLRVSHLGRHRYLLRFVTASHDAFFLSVRPDLPRAHLLTARRVVEGPPDPFSSWLDQEIGGAVLTGLELSPWDRVIALRFRAPRREGGPVERMLVVELLGRSANLLLLDGSGTILGFCRDLHSEFRSPAAGRPYAPPPGREKFGGLPVGPEAVPLIRDRFGGPAEFLSTLSPVLARDLLALEDTDPSAAERRLAEILTVARDGSWSPVVYSCRPLAELAEGDDLGRQDLVVSALPLLAPPGVGAARPPVVTPFASPSAAAEEGFGLLERLRDFRYDRDHHRALARKEVERLGRLIDRLQAELEGARGSDRHRRAAEALLAGLRSARVEGRVARVPDPYDPAAGSLTVPIDPALSLQENARLLFDRYKKGKRGVATIEKRLQAARSRLSDWKSLAARAAEVRDQAGLDTVREGMAGLGLVHGTRSARPGPPSRSREAPARVRRYESPDGWTILVGKSGEENDTLTFRVASAWDFWLHAAGRPGAHVVVRNPQRLKTLPDRTLRTAAEIAAFHSGAREESKVEVHYTQRKHVHKKKGMPSGQVLLRRFRSIQVAPRLPSSPAEDVS